MRSAFLTLVLVMSLCLALSAADNATETGQSQIAFNDILTPSGQLDADFIRNSGFEGSVTLPTMMPSAADDYWDTTLSPNLQGVEVDGTVYAMAIYDSKLVIGGIFSHAGGVNAKNIAIWDGTEWAPFGAGFDSTVFALAVYNGILFAGGEFDSSGWGDVSRIAKWSEYHQYWESVIYNLGGGYVRALGVFNDKLIVAGKFDFWSGNKHFQQIASWSSVDAWQPLGEGLTSSSIPYELIAECLTVYNNSLIVGGSFQEAGGNSANNIARWNGTTWSSLGSGTAWFQNIKALTVYGNDLIAGGDFGSIGGVTANHVARWNGSNWSALGLGVSPRVLALSVWDDLLIVGGVITYAGGASVNRIATWDGSTWSTLGNGVDGPSGPAIWVFAEFDGKLIVGGTFASAGEVQSVGNIVAWDGTYWQHLPKGTDAYITTNCVYDGDLVVAGEFTSISDYDPRVNHIALWDGNDWSALGTGLNGNVNAVVQYGNLLIAAGEFTEAGGTSANRIASWNGSSWSALGSGLNNTASALLVYNNNLYVGGAFTTAGGTTVNCIAKWNGTTWSALSNGMSGGGPGTAVRALTMFGALLVAGGNFTQAGGTSAACIAAWNGSTWTNLGTGMYPPEVVALTVYDGKLIAGGDFSHAGGNSAAGIAKWSGTAWSAFSAPLSSGADVRSLTTYQSRLVAAGDGLKTTPASQQRLVVWAGSDWDGLGSGLSGGLGQSLTEYDGSLVVSGQFDQAGAKGSVYIALWNRPNFCCVGTTGNVNRSMNETPDLADLSLLTSYLTEIPQPTLPCEAEADVNGSGTIDLSDLSLLNAYLTTYPRPTLSSCPQ